MGVASRVPKVRFAMLYCIPLLLRLQKITYRWPYPKHRGHACTELVHGLRSNFPGQKSSGVRVEDMFAVRNLKQKSMPVKSFIVAIHNRNLIAINAHFDGCANHAAASFKHWVKNQRRQAQLM